MKKSMFLLAMVIGGCTLGVTGCGGGGGGEPAVVETTSKGGELPPDQQQSYEEAMKTKQGPGN